MPETAMPKTGIIFDLDGLLVDSEPLWREAEVAVFATVGINLTEKMMSETVGMRTSSIISHWFAKLPWEGPSISDISSVLKARMTQLTQERTIAKPGALRLVKEIAEAGIPMAVCSSSPIQVIEAAIGSLGVKEHLSTVVSADDLSRGKPDPLPYQVTAKKIGLPSEQLAVLEDSVTGCQSAYAAGTFVVAVPEHTPERFSRELCHEVVPSLEVITVEWLIERVGTFRAPN